MKFPNKQPVLILWALTEFEVLIGHNWVSALASLLRRLLIWFYNQRLQTSNRSLFFPFEPGFEIIIEHFFWLFGGSSLRGHRGLFRLYKNVFSKFAKVPYWRISEKLIIQKTFARLSQKMGMISTVWPSGFPRSRDPNFYNFDQTKSDHCLALSLSK